MFEIKESFTYQEIFKLNKEAKLPWMLKMKVMKKTSRLIMTLDAKNRHATLTNLVLR